MEPTTIHYTFTNCATVTINNDNAAVNALAAEQQIRSNENVFSDRNNQSIIQMIVTKMTEEKEAAAVTPKPKRTRAKSNVKPTPKKK